MHYQKDTQADRSPISVPGIMLMRDKNAHKSRYVSDVQTGTTDSLVSPLRAELGFSRHSTGV